MKKTQKLFAILTIIAILISSLTFSVKATDSECFTVSNINLSEDDTEFTVNLVATKDIYVDDFDIRFSYDASKIAPPDSNFASYPEWAGFFTDSNNDAEESEVVIVGAGNISEKAGLVKAGQTMASVKFNVKEAFTTPITVTITSAIAKKDVSDVPAGTEYDDITTEDVSLTNTCTIKKAVSVSSITLSEAGPADLKVGETKEISATIAPAEADIKTVTWSTSNENIAKVTANGNNATITATGKGTATITATAGGKSATYTVNVIAPATAAKITDGAGKDLTEIKDLPRGGAQILEIVTTPADPSEAPTVVVTSSDNEVIEVIKQSNNKYMIKGLKEGEATVTVKVTDKITGKVLIDNTELDVNVIVIPLEGIKLPEKIEVELGQETYFDMFLKPENATEIPAMKFESSDEGIVKVDENGKLTAVALGKATIKVTPEGLDPVTMEVSVVEKKVDEPTDGTQDGEQKPDDKGTPHTADIAIEVVAVLMLISIAGIVFVVKKNKNKIK